MAKLVIRKGPDSEIGQQFALTTGTTLVGRQPEAEVFLPPKAVSRQHAHIVFQDGSFFVEDLDSANGTFLNGERLPPRLPTPFTDHDQLQIGPYEMALVPDLAPPTTDSWVIRDQISMVGLASSVYAQAPAVKLQVILEISQHLARTLDLDELLTKLFGQLMRLFPQADRSLFLMYQGGNLVIRGQHSRYAEDPSNYPYSRTVVQRALTEGMGILSEDAQADKRFDASATITSLNLRSLLCVPLICPDGRRLGVIQMDRFRPGQPFRSEDLQLLTTICLQMAVVLDNVNLHAELLREERLRQELALARDIQQGFLPSDFDRFKGDFELFACVQPARVVSGDLYDFCELPDGRLAFFVGDVSGKGMPAALFMVAVRTLSRHLAAAGDSPAQTLRTMNEALAKDNPSGLFVTLAHGIFDPQTGEIVFASGGHHLPLIRRVDGKVDELAYRIGRLLGIEGLELKLNDTKFQLAAGETLVFYTDGVTEARKAESKEMFGLYRLREIVAGFESSQTLPRCASTVHDAVHSFTRQDDLQDDVTLFLLRRKSM